MGGRRWFLSRAVILLGVVLLGLGLDSIAIKLVGGFQAFHELDDAVDGVFQGIVTLAVHLFLPGFGSAKKENIHDLVRG